jgi:predicted RNA-binding Zn-ribbon protein involved in translation (DUF1610 family)
MTDADLIWTDHIVDTIVCPACGETTSSPTRDHETVTDLDEYETDCSRCGADLVVDARVQFAFTVRTARGGL